MPRFEPNLAKAHAGFPMLERGEYEFSITKATPFVRTNDDGDVSAGCRCALRVDGIVAADGELETDFDAYGEMVSPISLWVHTPKAFGMTKQFILAALGYRLDQEKLANEEYFEEADFSIDTEDPDDTDSPVVAGASWQDLVGKSLRMTADIGEWNKRPQQEYRSYQPITS